MEARPGAGRALDFGHAVEHLTAAAEPTFGAKTAASQAWVGEQAHELKHDDPAAVLAALRALPVAQATEPAGAAAARDAALGYLEARWERIRYAAFRAMGWTIGSGMVESAGCPWAMLAVGARLKGAGMRRAEAHVDPMAALRTALCSEPVGGGVGPGRGAELRQQRRARAATRGARGARPADPPVRTSLDPLSWDDDRLLPPPLPPSRPKLVVSGRPIADHPWQRRPCLPPSSAPLAGHPKT